MYNYDWRKAFDSEFRHQHLKAREGKEANVREFTVRAYEDHWLVTEEGGGDTRVVSGSDALVNALAWQKPIGTPTVAKKVRKKRGPNKPKAESEATIA